MDVSKKAKGPLSKEILQRLYAGGRDLPNTFERVLADPYQFWKQFLGCIQEDGMRENMKQRLFDLMLLGHKKGMEDTLILCEELGFVPKDKKADLKKIFAQA